MMMRKLWGFVILAILLGSYACDDDNQNLNIDVSSIPKPSIKVKRYEQDLFPIPADSFISVIPRLQSEYPIFLNGDITDTASLIELKAFSTNPYMIELYEESMKQFPSLDQLEVELNDAFQHLIFYYPYINELQFYSYISGLDINAPVKFAEKDIVIGLDNYLGSEQEVYKKSGFPRFKVKWLIPERIPADIMNEVATGLMPEQQKGESLLDNMINKGKLLYFTQAMIPTIHDSLLLKYDLKQYTWCRTFEGKIWGLMIENQFLFKKDQTLVGKFMNDGPFTTVFSNTSPSRIGWFIGWRIVSSYMKRNDVSMEDLMQETDAKKILKQSKYKPQD